MSIAYKGLGVGLLLLSVVLLVYRVIRAFELAVQLGFQFNDAFMQFVIFASGDLVLLTLFGVVIFGIGHVSGQVAALVLPAARTISETFQRDSSLAPVPLPPPMFNTSTRFENETVFAQYVALLLEQSGRYTARPNGNLIFLTKHGETFGICAVALVTKGFPISNHVMGRLMQLKHEYGVKSLMIATTGIFDENGRSEARRAGVRLLDGTALERLDMKYRVRPVMA
jgi:hypothetical protein